MSSKRHGWAVAGGGESSMLPGARAFSAQRGAASARTRPEASIDRAHDFAAIGVLATGPGIAADGPVQAETKGATAPAIGSGGGRALPEDTRASMEQSFGHDFSDVRIHEGPQASSLGAVAFTRGSDIHFSPGTYAPGSGAGRSLLGHELAHVVQQREGRVRPTGRVGGLPLNDDERLESEADRLGRAASRSG